MSLKTFKKPSVLTSYCLYLVFRPRSIEVNFREKHSIWVRSTWDLRIRAFGEAHSTVRCNIFLGFIYFFKNVIFRRSPLKLTESRVALELLFLSECVGCWCIGVLIWWRLLGLCCRVTKTEVDPGFPLCRWASRWEKCKEKTKTMAYLLITYVPRESMCCVIYTIPQRVFWGRANKWDMCLKSSGLLVSEGTVCLPSTNNYFLYLFLTPAIWQKRSSPWWDDFNAP